MMLLALIGLLAAAGPAPAKPYAPPRTTFGDPSLEGEWSNLWITPLERPPGVTALALDGPEAEALERRLNDERLSSKDTLGQAQTEDFPRAPLVRIDGQARSSVVVSPPDGRLPLRPEGRAKLAAWRTASNNPTDNPEERPPADRCLLAGRSASGPPMLSAVYDTSYLVAQTRDEVVIVSEYFHDVRHIRLNAAHAPPQIRPWGGDSVGRWEGDTLVVETTNFHPQQGFNLPGVYISPQAHVTERFRRVSPTEIDYAFTVDDPATYSATWSGESAFAATSAPVYEYACHEGDYSMAGMLTGARAAAEAKAKAP
jgi:hypothetical protein